MTGLDMSAPALEVARELADAAGAETTFVEAQVYDALGVLEPESFDLVYTGVGALNWLPDITGWAGVVAGLLRPGGRLHLREGHPVLWAIDPRGRDGLLAIEYPYFETAEAVVLDDGEEHGTTYVETDEVFVTKVTHEWNHGLGEIVTALLGAGMELTLLEEHRLGSLGGPARHGRPRRRRVAAARPAGTAPAQLHAAGPPTVGRRGHG